MSDFMILERKNSRSALDNRSRMWYIEIAKDLYYPRRVVSQLKSAKTEVEAIRIMQEARRTCF